MQVASGPYRGNMEASLSHSAQSGGEIGPTPQVSITPDQQITALPSHPFRESNSSAITSSQTRVYGRALSHNPHASTSSNVSHDPFSHRRRGSTLKIVMRKIFGKRRQSHLEDDEVIERSPADRDQAVGLARGSNQMLFEKTKQPSDASVGPYTYNRKKSLVVSHPSSVSSDHIALSSQDQRIEISKQVIRRRATLPSLILTEDEDTKKSLFSSISPTSTRPISAINETHEDHEESKSQPSFRAHRRSRSADALQELVRRHRMSPIQWRRRSDEIKFWRTSVFEVGQEDTEEPQTSSTSDAPGAVASDLEEQENINDSVETPKSGPVSAPFQLENLLASMADPDATVEQRLTTLEVKLMDLEFAIAKIQGTDTNVFSKPTADCADESKDDEDTSNEPSSIASETSSQSSLSFGGGDRPISTSTLRPNMIYAQPTPWQGGSWSSMNLHGISIEQYSALVTLVRREQTARKALESQVAQLQEEMQQIRRLSVLPASPPGTLYPIPSPDSDVERFHRRRRPSPSRKDSNTSADTKYSGSQSRDSPKYRLMREKDSRNVSNMI
ncbi:hypothetical protein UA08_01270 [Talaromyces atroroseus]|uniref:Uncharacterized protein n=1 Tax=Talaromyces atroroseus TaxID=1441469 RepID=A0A1Q5QAX4_TALAT|nr:hypothetical protein UA08_01270 [Talaromyces atroroseus]OKL63076.1 hypothetical protein UA08_01270 [Talaromyces atroroseus]